jgi:hypothetical protein
MSVTEGVVNRYYESFLQREMKLIEGIRRPVVATVQREKSTVRVLWWEESARDWVGGSFLSHTITCYFKDPPRSLEGLRTSGANEVVKPC